MNTVDFSAMKLAELKEFAAMAGVALPSGARKAEIVAMLEKLQNEAEREEKSSGAPTGRQGKPSGTRYFKQRRLRGLLRRAGNSS